MLRRKNPGRAKWGYDKIYEIKRNYEELHKNKMMCKRHLKLNIGKNFVFGSSPPLSEMM